VYYRLPGNSPVANWVNQIGKYLLHENVDVDVQVAEYGYIDTAAVVRDCEIVGAGQAVTG
jgi:hypothetical protein